MLMLQYHTKAAIYGLSAIINVKINHTGRTFGCRIRSLVASQQARSTIWNVSKTYK